MAKVACRLEGEPGAPCATRLVHTGVPPVPFACDRAQTALVSPQVVPRSPVPPKTVMTLLTESYTAVEKYCPGGGPPVVESWVQFGVPPNPLAWLSTQTSEKVPQPLPPP